MHALLLSLFMSLFLPSSVSLSYSILAVPMRECFGRHSRMSSTFPIAILNDSTVRVSFLSVQLHVHMRCSRQYSLVG